jgi:23S rRNA pseudouridine1911/1915/1917 synthase
MSDSLPKPDPETIPASLEKGIPNLLTAQASDQGKRLDHFLQSTGKFSSRHQIQQLITSGSIRVNERKVKPSYRLRSLERIFVEIPAPTPSLCVAEPIPLSILHEDEDLLVVNKPAGMVVHPAAGHQGKTLVNALLHHCKDLSGIGGVQRPGIVHRLDKDTSGLLVVAKRNDIHVLLSRQFQSHSILREYLGIVHGALSQDRGTIDAPIGRHPTQRKKMSTRSTRGRRAVTQWEVLERLPHFTFVRFRLETGRTHQIRVHMAELRNPILGDPVYGGKTQKHLGRSWLEEERKELNSLNRLFLHAERLGFRHPRTGDFRVFSCPLPEDLEGVLRILRRREET